MRIKGFFGILVFLLLVLGGGLLFLSSRLNMIYFYIGEGLVLFILCYLPFFYRKIVKPLNGTVARTGFQQPVKSRGAI